MRGRERWECGKGREKGVRGGEGEGSKGREGRRE